MSGSMTFEPAPIQPEDLQFLLVNLCRDDMTLGQIREMVQMYREEKFHVHFFSSHTREHVLLGIGAKEWAVSPGTAAGYLACIKGKAKHIKVGDVGFVWVTSKDVMYGGRLYLPFVCVSEALVNEERVNHPWPGRWVCPFKIEPLNNYNKWITKKQLEVALKVNINEEEVVES